MHIFFNINLSIKFVKNIGDFTKLIMNFSILSTLILLVLSKAIRKHNFDPPHNPSFENTFKMF